MSDELHRLTIARAAKLLRSRDLSPVEYTSTLLSRIEHFDDQLNAFITVTPDLAVGQAREAEVEIMSGQYRGPLHGIPFALKDVFNTRGILTSGGSMAYMDNYPAADATTVSKLRDAGAVLIGKLQTHELSHGGPSLDLPWPPARNPWHFEHFTGGSSSGAGAALAAELVPAALGTDTGGSLRGPASFCGVAALMPTYGLVSRAGVIPYSFTFDRCGPIARTVEDCALLLQAIVGYDADDLGSIDRHIPFYSGAIGTDIKGLKIGVLRHFWEEDLPAHTDVALAMEDAMRVFKGLGAQLEDCRTLPVAMAFDIRVIIAESEIFSSQYKNLTSRAHQFGRDFLGRILPACLFQSADYANAAHERRRFVGVMEPLYKKYDVLLTAGFGPAPRIDTHKTINFWQKLNIFTPANLANGPSLAIPNGFSNGLPLGMQIIGRPFDEATVLRVGDAFERATDWHLRRPPLDVHLLQPPLEIKDNDPRPAAMSTKARNFILSTAQRSGLKLDDYQCAILLETAPYALMMADRMRASA